MGSSLPGLFLGPYKFFSGLGDGERPREKYERPVTKRRQATLGQRMPQHKRPFLFRSLERHSWPGRRFLLPTLTKALCNAQRSRGIRLLLAFLRACFFPSPSSARPAFSSRHEIERPDRWDVSREPPAPPPCFVMQCFTRAFIAVFSLKRCLFPES